MPRGAATNADGVTSGLHATGPTEPQKLAATEPLKLLEQQLAQQLLEQVYVKARTTVERLAGQRNSRCGFQAQRPLGRLAMAEWVQTQQSASGHDLKAEAETLSRIARTLPNCGSAARNPSSPS